MYIHILFLLLLNLCEMNTFISTCVADACDIETCGIHIYIYIYVCVYIYMCVYAYESLVIISRVRARYTHPVHMGREFVEDEYE